MHHKISDDPCAASSAFTFGLDGYADFVASIA